MYENNVKTIITILKRANLVFKAKTRIVKATQEKRLILLMGNKIPCRALTNLYLFSTGCNYYEFDIAYNKKHGELEIEIRFSDENLDITENWLKLE